MTTDKTISSTLAALAVVSFTNASFGNTTWECKGDLVIDGKTAQTRTGYCHLPYKQTCMTFDPELLDYYVNKQQSLWSYDETHKRIPVTARVGLRYGRGGDLIAASLSPSVGPPWEGVTKNNLIHTDYDVIHENKPVYRVFERVFEASFIGRATVEDVYTQVTCRAYDPKYLFGDLADVFMTKRNIVKEYHEIITGNISYDHPPLCFKGDIGAFANSGLFPTGNVVLDDFGGVPTLEYNIDHPIQNRDGSITIKVARRYCSDWDCDRDGTDGCLSWTTKDRLVVLPVCPN